MRIAVTGVGLVTPYGCDPAVVRASWADRLDVSSDPPEGERAAGDGIRVSRLPADFDPGQWVRRRKELKLMARANVLASAAAQLAVRDAGLEGAPALFEGGLFLGVGLEPGNLDDVLPTLARSRSADSPGKLDLPLLSAEGMRFMNPLSSIKTLPNMSHAHVGIALGTMGPGMTLCAGPSSGRQALVEAAEALKAGRATLCLAGASDAPVEFPDRVSAQRRGESGPLGEGAAIFVLEPFEAAVARGARILADLDALLALPDETPPFGRCGAADAALSLAVRLPLAGDRVRRETPAPCREPIAIVGIGLRTPLGNDFATFGRRLLAGESAVAPLTLFPRAGFPVQLACEVADVQSGALPDTLRAAFEGLDDRKGELAVAAGWAAVDDAGFVLPPETALVYATGLSSVSLEELEEDCLPFVTADARYDHAAFGRASPQPHPQAPTRHDVERPARLLAEHLALHGPRSTHFSACAAGAAAIGQGIDLLRRGDAPVVLVGAADSMIHPFGLLPFILLGATSPNADQSVAARPFDQARDGFVMGEAGVFFVLEPLSRARLAGHTVYGCLLGHGTSSDAHNVTAPHPEGAGAVRAMRRALSDAGVEPGAVDYINAHGTGTPLNDVIEAGAIRAVFGADAPPVSSCKAQFGHTIAAAGAVELAACLAALAAGRLPPNPTLVHRDPRIDLDLVEPTGRKADVKLALSNSFGFGGQNATLVVGRAPPTSGE